MPHISPKEQFSKLTHNRESQLMLVATGIGVIAAFVTFVFHHTYQLVNQTVFGEFFGFFPRLGTTPVFVGYTIFLLPFVVAGGATLAYLFEIIFKPHATAHGTDIVIEAYHNGDSKISGKSSWVTIITTSLALGTGGSAGMEGPIALIGASIGSTIGRVLNFDAKTRRMIMLMGVSAGLGAIFKAPVGAAFFAIEFLYRDMNFEADALLYTLISAVAGYAVIGTLSGWEASFALPAGLGVTHLTHFFWFAVLGLSGGLLAAIIPTFFYATKSVFGRLPGPFVFKPLVGGLIVGGIGTVVPQILGPGTTLLQDLLNTNIPASMLIAYIVLKIVTFSVTIGSSNFGGVLVPNLFIGGMLGALIANLSGTPQAPLVLVGMATVFAAAGRTPIAALLMVPEITGNYALLPPTALAVAISYLIQVVVANQTNWPTLHHAQPADLWSSPTHHEEVLTAGIQLLQKGGIQLPPEIDLPDLEALLSIGYPVPLGAGGLIITRGELKAESIADGKQLQDSPFGPGVWILEIKRGDQVLFPEPGMGVESGDIIVMMTSTAQIPEISRSLAFPSVFSSWLSRHEPEVHKVWQEVQKDIG